MRSIEKREFYSRDGYGWRRSNNNREQIELDEGRKEESKEELLSCLLALAVYCTIHLAEISK
jgi:hypothetical protein